MAPEGPGLVWYVAYGSNMLRDRLLAYIEGADVAQFGGAHHGAEDSRPPIEDRLVRVPHRLWFGGHSVRWNGPVAFIDPDRTPASVTLGRAYLLRWGQVESVAAQENGARSVRVAGLPRPRHKMALGLAGKYDTLVRLDDLGGFPAVALTTGRRLPPGDPPDDYLRTVERGIRGLPGLPPVQVEAYLADVRARAGRRPSRGRQP